MTASTYVLIAKAARETGYSVKAIEMKIERGVWVEGREWRRAPDRHRLIDLRAVQSWIERGYNK